MSDRIAPKSLYQQENEAARVHKEVGGNLWREKEQAEAVAALRQQAKDLIRRGAMMGQLPNIHGNMSRADITNAQARLNQLDGMSPTDARDPRLVAHATQARAAHPYDTMGQRGVNNLAADGIPAAPGPIPGGSTRPANSRLPAPAGSVQSVAQTVAPGTPQPKIRTFNDIGGTTQPAAVLVGPGQGDKSVTAAQARLGALDKITAPTAADFQREFEQQKNREAEARLLRERAVAAQPAPVSIPAGDPEARRFFGKPSTPEPSGAAPQLPPQSTATPNQGLVDAAGKGVTIQTDYGPVSSRTVKTGTPEATAVTTATGVQREAPNPDGRDWERALVRQYPNLGKPGTREHDSFVESVLKREAADPNFKRDIHGTDLAREMFNKAPEGTIAGYTASTSPNVPPTPSEPPTGTIAGYTQSTSPTVPFVSAVDYAKTEPAPPQDAVIDANHPFVNPDHPSMHSMYSGVGGWTGRPRPIASTAAPSPALPTVNPETFWNTQSSNAPGTAPLPQTAASLPYDGSQQAAKTPKPSGFWDISQPATTPSLDSSSSMSLRVPNPQPGMDFKTPMPPTSASTGSSSSLPTFTGWDAPGASNSANLASAETTPKRSRWDDAWQPDEDSQAFARNPADDQFRKALREPKQLNYSYA
jgi:hypothetical protein